MKKMFLGPISRGSQGRNGKCFDNAELKLLHKFRRRGLTEFNTVTIT